MDMSYSVVVNDAHEEEVSSLLRLGARLAISSIFHPFEYCRVLIQLGYEPIAPWPGYTFLGKPVMFLPNIFQYVNYVRKVDGFCGMYRGLTPRLIGSIIGLICSRKVAEKLGLPADQYDSDYDSDDEDGEWELTDEDHLEFFERSLKRDAVLCISWIIVGQPFHVISVRMMAQFIGRETMYRSIIGSIIEIYRNDGILGFFSGLFPKLLGHIACLFMTSSVIFIANRYLVEDISVKKVIASSAQLSFTWILYPLQTVSTCMIVTGSGLIAGGPPFMPYYTSAWDCWKDLNACQQLKRGSTWVWRYIDISSRTLMKTPHLILNNCNSKLNSLFSFFSFPFSS